MGNRLTYALVLGVCAAWWSGCGRVDEERGSRPGAPIEAPDQESWNSRIILSDRGATTAILQAGHIRQYDKTQQADVDSGLTVDFFAKDGSHTSTLTAQRGVYYSRSKNMTARGRVVVVSESEDTLRTEELMWDNARRKILAEGSVRISNPRGVQTGIGLESSADLKDWTLREVTGVYEGELGRPKEE